MALSSHAVMYHNYAWWFDGACYQNAYYIYIYLHCSYTTTCYIIEAAAATNAYQKIQDEKVLALAFTQKMIS